MPDPVLPTLAFDVYGTLVDPLEMDEPLRHIVGNDASPISALWRQKQLEYTFRRGLMRRYEDFGVCTRQALEYAARAYGVELTGQQIDHLVAEYQNLRAFEDVVPGLRELAGRGYSLVAFSNGVEDSARKLLANAGVLDHLDGVVSVADTKTFKPAPEVYEHLAKCLDRKMEGVLLVSSNPFDIIGAANCRMRTAWVQRNPDTPFDPWGIEPGFTVTDINHLAEVLP